MADFVDIPDTVVDIKKIKVAGDKNDAHPETANDNNQKDEKLSKEKKENKTESNRKQLSTLSTMEYNEALADIGQQPSDTGEKRITATLKGGDDKPSGEVDWKKVLEERCLKISLTFEELRLPFKNTVHCDFESKSIVGTKFIVVFSSPTSLSPVAKSVARLLVFYNEKDEMYFSTEHGSIHFMMNAYSKPKLRKIIRDRIDREFLSKKDTFEMMYEMSDLDLLRAKQASQKENYKKIEKHEDIVSDFELSRLEFKQFQHILKNDNNEMEESSAAPPSVKIIPNTFSIYGKSIETSINQVKERKKKKCLLQDVWRNNMLHGEPDVRLAERLVNVFGSADEDDECILEHREVQNLCEATLMDPAIGLTRSDIRVLLSIASENEDGYIDYRPFVESAALVVDTLRKRRKRFEEQEKVPFEPSVSWEEMIVLHIGEEIEETSRIVQKMLELHCQTTDITQVPRNKILKCLQETKRFTQQEIRILMQMIPQPKESMEIQEDEVLKMITTFRIEVLQNPIVETDITTIDCYIRLKLKEIFDEDPDNIISIWHCKRALMSLEHICLSIFHVHALLCILTPDAYGFVTDKDFIREVCRYVPTFFNARNINICALETAKEKADALAARELRELQELQGKQVQQREKTDPKAGFDDDSSHIDEDEDLEKALVQFFQLHDRQSGERGCLEIRMFMDLCRDNLKQNYGFTELEVRGFIAHAEINQNGEVPFHEHIKENVPLILMFRKCRYLYELVHNVNVKHE